MALKPITSLKSLLSEVGAPDRLILLERLGVGGQAEVWLARDQMLERFVTVKKVPSLKSLEDGTDNERLKSLRARAEMEHPAIPTLFSVVPNGDQSWLVSEYVEGVALSEVLGELSPESIYAVAKDLLSALRCLERLSLVHGDLSPNNIVIDRTGQVRLLDFESCSRIGEALSSTSTIGFSAPERHSRRAGLPTVDTWSVGAILIWLVTQRTPEIVLDDAKQPISVTIGTAIPATDVLGDVINIAAAATRLDPSLRPLTADLEERLSLSYRWLEPVNRSALEMLVRSRLLSTSQWEGRPPAHAGSANLPKKNPKSETSAKGSGHSGYLAPWRKNRGWTKRVRIEDGSPEGSMAKFAGSGWGSSGWFSAKWGDETWFSESRAKRGLKRGAERGVESRVERGVKSTSDRQPSESRKQSIGTSLANRWLNRQRFFSATLLRLSLLSLGLAALAGVYSSFLSEGQPYSVRVDTTRLSPATALPDEFSPQWVESIFSRAMPDNWQRVSNAEVFPQVPLSTKHKDGVSGDSELLAQGQPNEAAGGDESLKIEGDVDNQTHSGNGPVTEVIISINCTQGICELLTEHTGEEASVLNHTVVLGTGDARIWHAAIAGLAKSISAE